MAKEHEEEVFEMTDAEEKMVDDAQEAVIAAVGKVWRRGEADVRMDSTALLLNVVSRFIKEGPRWVPVEVWDGWWDGLQDVIDLVREEGKEAAEEYSAAVRAIMEMADEASVHPESHTTH